MGFVEPPPRSRPRDVAPAWWVALAVVAVVLGVWFARRPEPAPEAKVTARAAKVEQASTIDPLQAQQIVHLQQLLSQAEQNLAEQKEQIADLQHQLEVSRSDAEHQRQALEQAVGQLERLNNELVDLQSALATAESRPSVPAPPVREVAPLGAPFVSTSQFGYVVASGLVYNPTDYSERGTLEVSLVGSGGVIDTRGFVMTVGAGRTERYDVTFTNIFPTERLGAQARWVR